ncbi:Hypothetical protein DPCES_0858 [Desulfitobacterium hafniense]|uniref:Uncharacterized protein n=1 Tax=Desulfitobacterium hafniense TaxID=49338 RepID=A0A098AXB4_DESHA|nr:Hypothetical protein DPCES_0858 [Desulfitobacterium hafniense]
MITVVVPTQNTNGEYPPCTKCFKCELPRKENKCGKFDNVPKDGEENAEHD